MDNNSVARDFILTGEEYQGLPIALLVDQAEHQKDVESALLGKPVLFFQTENELLGCAEKSTEVWISPSFLPRVRGWSMSRVVLLTTTKHKQQAFDALSSGAVDDVVLWPLGSDDIELAWRRGLHNRVGTVCSSEVSDTSEASEVGNTKQDDPILSPDIPHFHGMVGLPETMGSVFSLIEKVAAHKATVFIRGESGTGKELVARAVHDISPRYKQRFVAINCGAVPENLIESELFGHVKGSFTDAIRDKPGLFSEANGGTLFLDEIGELPLALQVRLLRALQEKEIRPVGSTDVISVDVRIIAATLQDIEKAVREGRFREDLYYRLNVLPIELPTLRERKADIPLLASTFLKKARQRHGRGPLTIDDVALQHLVDYDWPGNIRQLENAIERACVMSDSEILRPEDLDNKVKGNVSPS